MNNQSDAMYVFLFTALKKPNSVKEWNELIASMLYHNHQQSLENKNPQLQEKSEKALTNDLTALVKLRNRRIRQQGGGSLRCWPTANADLFLKCQETVEKYSQNSDLGALAAQIIKTIEQLEVYEGQLAMIES